MMAESLFVGRMKESNLWKKKKEMKRIGKTIRQTINK